MTRFTTLLACSLLLPACATTGGSGPRSRAASLDLAGTLALSDGTAVAGAHLALRCPGAAEQRASTDERGRFSIRGVPEGSCSLTCPEAGLAQSVRVSRGLLGAGATVDLRLPPVRRLKLEWRAGNERGSRWLDERVPHALPAGRHLLALADGHLLVDGQKLAALEGLRVGRRLTAGKLQLTVAANERRPFLPLRLRRGPAAAGSFSGLPLFTPDGQVAKPVLGARTLVVAGACEQLRVELVDELESLAVSHETAGLRAFAILTEPCPQPSRGGSLLLGGAEALWVLGARPGEVTILDGEGRGLRRVSSPEEARAYLERTFPPVAAVSKVSVAHSASVLEAEAERLLAQARAKQKAGRNDEAHQLLDAVLKLTPDLAEARKERALIKAKLGDLSGAMTEVTWWRSSFGPDSADDLLDEVQRTAKVSTLR